MNLSKRIYNGFILSVVAVSTFLFLGTVKIYQTGEIKADGSGSMTLTYSASTSEVKKNNNLIGNFPFTQQTVKDYFTSPNNQVKSAVVYKNKNDTSMTSVTVVIAFKNIDKISEAKGFSGIKASYRKIDDKSKLFSWTIPPGVAGQIDQITGIFTFECESLNSSNGVVKDKTITYYRNNKKADFTKDVAFSATIKTDGKTESSGDTEKKPDGDGKSCGLFGLELPLIMLAGLVFTVNRKRKKSNS